MARIRTIKPQHVTDKELPNISLQAHLFWLLSWCFSDDDGVLENDPLLLKSQIFPRRNDIRVEQISQWIDQLTKARFMIPFSYNGEGYLLQRTFNVHQKIDRPQPSKIPSEIIEKTRRTFDEHSTNDRPCIVEDSNSKVKGRANALVAASPDISASLQIDYKKLIESVTGKELKDIWLSLRDFIIKNKPGFIEPYVDAWNVFGPKLGLSKVDSISDSRRKKFRTRIKEDAFDFIKILEKIKKSAYLKGDNNAGWKVSFDWVLENDKNYLKILEGNYE
jgi:hypothetical protein